MFKRIALMAIILILSITLNVYAGATMVLLESNVTEVEAGDTITIKVLAKCGTRIEGIDSVLDYDKTKLELTNASTLAAEGFTSMSETNDLTGKFQLSLMYTGTGSAPYEADVATLTFKVLDTVKAKETLTIKLANIELGDSEDEWTELADQTVSIKVAGEPEPEPEPEPDPEYPYAGVGDYVFIAIGIIIIAVVLYKKSNKYNDIV